MSYLNDSVARAEVTGEDVSKTVNLMIPALEGVPSHLIVISAIALAITEQEPNINIQDLQSTILSTSQFICLKLAEINGEITEEPLAANLVN